MILSKPLSLTLTLSALFLAGNVYAQETNATDDNKSTAAATMQTTTKSTAKAGTSETNALATVAAIDKNEILLGIVAANKKTNSNVTDFAKMMIDQHGSNLTQLMEMASNLHAAPLKSPGAEKVKEQGAKEMASLGGLQGAEFDKAYVDAMVKGHQDALDMIDKLLKTTKSDEVKNFLNDTRATVANHLEEAKKLQNSMKS